MVPNNSLGNPSMPDHAPALATALERLITSIKESGLNIPSRTDDPIAQAEAVLAAWKGNAGTSNVLFTLVVTREQGIWAFDDPTRGLVREPFVAGADTAFDLLAQQHGCTDRLTVTVSSSPFPGVNLRLTRLRFGDGGAWYHIDPLGVEGWLCPATLRFFAAFPEVMHAAVAP